MLYSVQTMNYLFQNNFHFFSNVWNFPASNQDLMVAPVLSVWDIMVTKEISENEKFLSGLEIDILADKSLESEKKTRWVQVKAKNQIVCYCLFNVLLPSCIKRTNILKQENLVSDLLQ